MKRILFLVALCLLLSSCSNERSRRYEVDGIKIINLYGTWEEMGYDFGRLASKEIQDVELFLESKYAGDEDKIEKARQLSERIFKNYPSRLKQYVRGMAKSTGIPMDKILMINAVEYSEGLFQCSGAAVWDDYAKDNLIYGRNYDALSYGPINNDIVITVFHPNDGSIPVATIGYAGEVYAVNAVNAKGIFMELNNGSYSGGDAIDFDRFMSTTSLLEMMFDAENLSYVDAFFKTTRCNFSFLIGVSDKNEARSYEWCNEGAICTKEHFPEGKMVMTNHFINKVWDCPPESDIFHYSATRHFNLDNILEALRGDVDMDKMCEVMDIPLNYGGTKNPDYTLYQIVFEPATLTMKIQIKDGPSWTTIDLKKFL